jgi:hypothetical protein
MQSNFYAKILTELVVTTLCPHPELHLTLEQSFVELELVLLLKTFSSYASLLYLRLRHAKIWVCDLVAPLGGIRIFSPTAAVLVS